MKESKRQELRSSTDEKPGSVVDEKLMDLLKLWNVAAFYDNLRSCGFDTENMIYIEEGDYILLIGGDHTKLGLMVTFRHYHRKWKYIVKQLQVKGK